MSGARLSVQMNDGQDAAMGTTTDAAGASTGIGLLKALAGVGTVPAVTKVTPTSASSNVLAANANRVAAIIRNASSVTVFLNFGAAATTNSFPLEEDEVLPPDLIGGYTGSITAITVTDPGDLRVIEVTRA